MSEQRVVVMGLGNLLWADEGFGVRVAERLYAHYHWPEDVEIVDGGTQGLNLLGYVESAGHLLILDAIDYGLEPGTLRTYAGERIPAYLSAKKMSLHQNSFLRSAGAGRYPRTSASTYCPRRSATRDARRLRRQPERTGAGATARCGTGGAGAAGCVGNCAATG
ncbi:hydrogenase 1 maturation protease [Escherichia coli]|uniref:Hydrogenase 1 maturation protease n=1 Tax=Escherichia coli TaxID=562 RepID=A0A376W5B6_ECOLX|nr:hydrogenase 1 maturation protease [Escherichia coli]